MKRFFLATVTIIAMLPGFSFAYDWSLPVPIAGLEGLEWNTSPSKAKLSYPDMTCLSPNESGVEVCSRNTAPSFLPDNNVQGKAELSFWDNQLFSVKIAYHIPDEETRKKQVTSILDFLREQSGRELKVSAPIPGKTVYALETHNTTLELGFKSADIVLSFAREWHYQTYTGAREKFVQNTSEQAAELNRLKLTPKEPKLQYTAPSKFDKDKKALYRLNFYYDGEFASQKLPNYMVSFWGMKYGQEYYLGAAEKSIGYPSPCSLEIIVGDEPAISLKFSPVAGYTNTFAVPPAVMNKMANAKAIDFKLGTQIFHAEKFKEDWFSRPDYTEGSMGAQRIKWIKRFVEETAQ